MAIAVNAVILFYPRPSAPEWFRYEDKVVHAAIFAAPAFLASLMWRAPVAALTLAGYGAASELIQGFALPGRSGSVTDWLADLTGVALGVAAAWVVGARRHTRQ